MKAKLKTPAFQYGFCILSFLSALFFIKLKVPFTGSGEITFYFTEILGLALGAFLIFYLFKNFKKLSKEHKIIFWTAFVSQFVFLAIYACRVILSGIELKSILVIESNLFVISFMFMVLLGIVSSRIVVRSMTLFFTSLSVLSMLLMFFVPASYTDWSLFACDLFYVSTFGNAIRTYLVLICLPVSVMDYLHSKNKLTAICLIAQIFSLTVCGMVSGARINYLCIPLVIVAVAIILVFFNNKKKDIKMPATIVSVFALAVVFVFFVSQFFFLIYSQMMRLDITKSVMNTLNIEYIELFPSEDLADSEKLNNMHNEMIDQAESSAAQSSSSRRHMWSNAFEDIKKAPFFGEGLKQYEFDFGSAVLVMQAHNFVIEYLLAFGLVGFFFWAIMMMTPEYIMLKKVKFKFWRSAPLLLAFCSMFLACIGAFVQPYFLYPNIMFFIFVMIGTYYSEHEKEFSCVNKNEENTCKIEAGESEDC